MLKMYMTYMYRELTHTSLLFSPCFLLGQLRKMSGSIAVECIMSDIRPKRARNPSYAATRAGYAPSLAFRAIMLRADTQRSEKGFRGCSGERSPDHPRKPPSLLWVSAWRSSLDLSLIHI